MGNTFGVSCVSSGKSVVPTRDVDPMACLNVLLSVYANNVPPVNHLNSGTLTLLWMYDWSP